MVQYAPDFSRPLNTWVWEGVGVDRCGGLETLVSTQHPFLTSEDLPLKRNKGAWKLEYRTRRPLESQDG